MEEAMAGFCPTCGKPVGDGAAFCGGCGSRLQSSVPSQAPSEPVSSSPAGSSEPPAGQARPSAPKASGGGCGKALLIAGLVLGLIAALAIGGLAYLAYRAKKKVDEVHRAYKENDLNKMAAALGGKPAESKPVGAMPKFPDWNPANSANVLPASAAAPPVRTASEQSYGSILPIRKGMTMTAAIEESLGDYETLLRIAAVGDDGVLMNLSSGNVPVPENPFDKGTGGKPKTMSARGRRRILARDMKTAHEYAEQYSERMPDTFPGTFSLGFSSDMYADLKGKGETSLTYWQVGLKGALGGLVNGLGQATGMPSSRGGGAQGDAGLPPELADVGKARCALKLKDPELYSFPVLVNGERKAIPALRASCESEDGKADFYFLDDPANALILAWQIGSSARAQLTKVDYPAEEGARAAEGGSGGSGSAPAAAASAGARQLEQKLEQQEKVEIYGIYFDFASAEIRPESKPTLDEIAEVMKTHPGWKLSVAGHTDNIGGEAFNLDLSRKRAEAVKTVLAAQYHVGSERLVPSGHGASQPVETNDTLEGRARNRRVELSRE
jgi:outer membrane protein OmpA-like peptidoglycan-associated protein